MYSIRPSFALQYAVSQAIGDQVKRFIAPASGFIYDILLHTTTTWAGATNKLLVQVGTAGDNDLFAELQSGATAANGVQSARYTNTADVSIVHQTTNKFDKGDTVVITITAPAGSGAAGVGELAVIVCLEA